MSIYDFKIFDLTRFDRAPKVYLFRTRRNRQITVFGARSEATMGGLCFKMIPRTYVSIDFGKRRVFVRLTGTTVSPNFELDTNMEGWIYVGVFCFFFLVFSLAAVSRERSMTAVDPRRTGRTGTGIFTSIILCRSRTITRIEFNRPNTVSSSNSQAQRPKYLADSSPISFLHLA